MNRPFRTSKVSQGPRSEDLVQARLFATARLAGQKADVQPTVGGLLALLESESPLDQRMAARALEAVGSLARDAILALRDVLQDEAPDILPFVAPPGHKSAVDGARKYAA